MKNFDINKRYMEISIYSLAVILLSFIFGRIIWNITGFGVSINNSLKFLGKVLAPFIYGFFIAYFMNSTMRYLEQTVLRHINWFHSRTRIRRISAVTATYLIYIGCLFWFFSFLVPEILDNIKSFWYKLPADMQYYQNFFFENLGPESNLAALLATFNLSFDINLEILNRILHWLNASAGSVTDIINTLLTGTMSFASTIFNFILGLVIAFYMLCDKEHYAEATRKILVIIMKKNTCDRFISTAADSNRMIENFIIGKAIDSIIVGMIFFAITLIIRPPYALLLTLIVGITNMIPYFGPIAGAIVSALIVLPTNPSMAPLVMLIIFILQQFDNIYLGPKILGESTGLSPILVIFAIVVGGAVAGMPGMFFGVPFLAIIRNIVTSFIEQKYNQKQFGGSA